MGKDEEGNKWVLFSIPGYAEMKRLETEKVQPRYTRMLRSSGFVDPGAFHRRLNKPKYLNWAGTHSLWAPWEEFFSKEDQEELKKRHEREIASIQRGPRL